MAKGCTIDTPSVPHQCMLCMQCMCRALLHDQQVTVTTNWLILCGYYQPTTWLGNIVHTRPHIYNIKWSLRVSSYGEYPTRIHLAKNISFMREKKKQMLGLTSNVVLHSYICTVCQSSLLKAAEVLIFNGAMYWLSLVKLHTVHCIHSQVKPFVFF